jgi:hypothetical protein
MKLKSIKPANDNIHKFVATIETDDGNQRTVRFGAYGMSDYTKNKDPERKKRYLARHEAREDWTKSGILTRGFWSRWILWNLPTLQASVQDVRSRFDL